VILQFNVYVLQVKQLSSQSSSGTGSKATTAASKGNKGALEFGNADASKQALLEVRNNIDGTTW
jgi:hypothetical protein